MISFTSQLSAMQVRSSSLTYHGWIYISTVHVNWVSGLTESRVLLLVF